MNWTILGARVWTAARVLFCLALVALGFALGSSRRPAPGRYDALDLSTVYAGPAMGVDEALAEWKSSPRRMGCATAATWFCRRVPRFRPVALNRTLPDGSTYRHIVAFDGVALIDLQPLNDTTPAGRWIDQWASEIPGDLLSAYYAPKVCP